MDIWNMPDSGEVAKVSVKNVLTKMWQKKAIDGLIFNVYDEKRSMAIAGFSPGM